MMTPTSGFAAFLDTFSALRLLPVSASRNRGGKVVDYPTKPLNLHYRSIYGLTRSKSAFTLALYLISPLEKPISALPLSAASARMALAA